MPVPVAEMVAVLPSTFVEAWPEYFAVNGTLVVGSAVAAAAEASAATARVTSAVRNFVMGMLLVGPDVLLRMLASSRARRHQGRG